ncbi:Uncharacterised protein [Mycobacteroides abscessus]|nr:Uncharacterised protein [Mycobacteroides abscessus]
MLGRRRLLRAERPVRRAELAVPVGGEHGREGGGEQEEARDDEAGDEHAALQPDALPELVDDGQALPPRDAPALGDDDGDGAPGARTGRDDGLRDHVSTSPSGR